MRELFIVSKYSEHLNSNKYLTLKRENVSLKWSGLV